MPWTFERVAGPYKFTEGPVWDGRAVLFSDIPNDRIMRYDPATSECVEHITNTGGVNGNTLDSRGRLYSCAGDARRVVHYDLTAPTEAPEVLATHFEGRRLNKPNDVVVDSKGRVWFTDPCYGDRSGMELDHESVYCLDPPNGDTTAPGPWLITRVTFDTTRPNGLVFSPDERTLYIAESPPAPNGARQLRAYPVQEDGTLGPMRVLHDFGPNRGIDGMRVDATGHVVAACGWEKGGPGPRVGIFSPDGAEVESHPAPHNPTNLTFAGDDLTTIYVTDATGSLQRAQTNRRGLARSSPRRA
jgi:gluconolactonase